MSTNSLNLELRQDTAELDVPLFDLGETESAIHAEGSMGECGAFLKMGFSSKIHT